MKKLGKLNLMELKEQVDVLDSAQQRKIVGGTTFSQYEAIERSGNWNGGHVQGYGYIGPTVCCFGCGEYNSMSYSTWSSNNSTGFMDRMASRIMGEIPIAGSILGAVTDHITNERWAANTALLNAGIRGCSSIYFGFDSYQSTFSIYSQAGTLIYQSTPFLSGSR